MAQGVTIIFNLIMMKILSLNDFGVYSYARTIAQYFDYSNIGTRYAMDRLVPVSSKVKSDLILHLCLFSTQLIAYSVFILLLSLGIISGMAEVFFVIAGICFAFSNIYCVYRRDCSDLNVVIVVNFLASVLPISAALIACLLHLPLITIAEYFFTGQLLLLFILLIKYKLFSFFFKLPRSYIRSFKFVFLIGFPMFVASFVTMLGMTEDRLFIKHFFGYAALGKYSIILYVFSFLIILPNVLGQVFMPEIIRDVRQGSSREVTRAFWFLIALLVPLLVFICALIPFAVKVFLPKYSPYALYMCFASLVVIPYAMMFPFLTALNALDKRSIIVKINFFSVIVYSVLLLGYFKITSNLSYSVLLDLKLSYGLLNVILLYIVFKFELKKFLLKKDNV